MALLAPCPAPLVRRAQRAQRAPRAPLPAPAVAALAWPVSPARTPVTLGEAYDLIGFRIFIYSDLI